jgi:hypothetical protein
MRVLSIARDHSGLRGGRGLSLCDLILECDYQNLRPQIEAGQLAVLINAQPAIVDDWRAYCEDKRTNSGWAFAPSREGKWIIYGPGGIRHSFACRFAACADYVIRELDFWTALSDTT